MLQAMRRGYTREAYDTLANHIRETIPGVCSFCLKRLLLMEIKSAANASLEEFSLIRGVDNLKHSWYDQSLKCKCLQVTLSTDIIAGFCGESEEDHAASVDLMSQHAFEQAFMFAYSRREGTNAARHLQVLFLNHPFRLLNMMLLIPLATADACTRTYLL